MTIYRERVFSYALAGIFAVILGFWPSAFITQIVQPAVGIWITSTAVMIFWASITKAFRDPMINIAGVSLRSIVIGLVLLGILMTIFSFARSSVGWGTTAVLCLLFAVDTSLSGRESIRRYEAANSLNGRSS